MIDQAYLDRHNYLCDDWGFAEHVLGSPLNKSSLNHYEILDQIILPHLPYRFEAMIDQHRALRLVAEAMAFQGAWYTIYERSTSRTIFIHFEVEEDAICARLCVGGL